jgi:hypothetical protein
VKNPWIFLEDGKVVMVKRRNALKNNIFRRKRRCENNIKMNVKEEIQMWMRSSSGFDCFICGNHQTRHWVIRSECSGTVSKRIKPLSFSTYFSHRAVPTDYINKFVLWNAAIFPNIMRTLFKKLNQSIEFTYYL